MLTEFSYPKKFRLINKGDFQNLRSDSRFLVSDLFLAIYKKNEFDNSRLGLAVSKKYGCAVRRNRIKRKVREYFRQNEIVSNNLDVLITMNLKNLNKKKYKEEEVEQLIEPSLNKIFKQLKGL